MKSLVVILLVLLIGGAFGYFFFEYRGLAAAYLNLQSKYEDQLMVTGELTKKAEEAVARETVVREQAAAERLELQTSINKLRADKASLSIALKEAKEETAALPDSELAEEMNVYLDGKEVHEARAGWFSLSRPGAEKSLNLFKELTFTLALREKDRETVSLLENQIGIFTGITVPSYELELSEVRAALDSNQSALSACNNLLLSGRKSQFRKGITYGIGGTATVVLIFMLLRGL